MTQENKKMTAVCTVHWATGPVNCCLKHAEALKRLGEMLGSHIAVTKLDGVHECVNCTNEIEE